MTMPVRFAKEWSRADLVRPEDQIVSHAKITDPKFTPSYDKNCTPTCMNLLLGWEYGRLWLEDRSTFVKNRLNKEMRKHIKNDYQAWLTKRIPKPKKSLI